MAFLYYLLASFVFGAVFARTLPREAPIRPVPAPGTCFWRGKTYPLDREGKFRPSPCESCVCERGRAQCMSAMCAPPACVDAELHPDQCCPVCPNGENCAYKDGGNDIIIKKGEAYHPDANTVCSCPDIPFHFGSGAICLQKPVKPKFIFKY